MGSIVGIGLPVVVFVVAFALLYRVGKMRDTSEGRAIHGRVSPSQNAVLIALGLLGVPLVLVLPQLDNGRIRQLILLGYIVVVALAAGLFRLRYQRMHRD